MPGYRSCFYTPTDKYLSAIHHETGPWANMSNRQILELNYTNMITRKGLEKDRHKTYMVGLVFFVVGLIFQESFNFI